MHDPHPILIVALAIAGATLVAVQPFPAVGFVLQMGGVGAAIGTVVSVWRRHRDDDAEMSLYIVRWTVVGLAGGAVWALADAVL